MDESTTIALVMLGWVIFAFFFGVFIGRNTGRG